jgi:hypothetical protein
MLRSSVAAQVTFATVAGLVALPLAYVALALGTVRLLPAAAGPSWRRRSIGLVMLAAWVIFGQHSFNRDWTTRRDHQVAANAQWTFVASWWQMITGAGVVRMAERFAPADLTDFEPRRGGPMGESQRRRL